MEGQGYIIDENGLFGILTEGLGTIFFFLFFILFFIFLLKLPSTPASTPCLLLPLPSLPKRSPFPFWPPSSFFFSLLKGTLSHYL